MKNKQKPLISILVSVFNLENYIERCLISILNQDFSNYELFLVDNGSTDGSIEICEKYAKLYNNKITYVKLPPPTVIGRPHSYAASHMNGQYFMIIDGDDYILEGSLNKIANVILNDNPDLIMGTFICDPEPGAHTIHDTIFEEEMINNVSYQSALKYLGNIPNFQTVMWRFITKRALVKKYIEKTNFNYIYKNKSQSRLSELYGRFSDFSWVSLMFVMANSIHYISSPFYVYRRRYKDSLSADFISDNAIIDFLKAVLLLVRNLLLIFDDKKINKEKICFIKNQLYKNFTLFRFNANTITNEGYIQIAHIIDANLEYFYKLRDFKIDSLGSLCDLVEKYGVLQGIMMHRALEEANLFKAIMSNAANDWYVLPNGVCATSTANLLKRWGLNVIGYFDNNESKFGIQMDGLTCVSPNYIQELNFEEKNNTALMIATSTKSLQIILKRQLQELGIKENQIFIRE